MSSVCLSIGTVAPLVSAHLLIEPWGWRLFFYVVLAFALALFVLAFLFVEESSYDRDAHMHLTAAAPVEDASPSDSDKPTTRVNDEAPSTTQEAPLRKPFLQTLSLKGRYDPEAHFFGTMAMSFTYFLVPQVFWVITSFGIYIGLGAFAYNYTFPIKIMAPPYNWPEVRLVPIPSSTQLLQH